MNSLLKALLCHSSSKFSTFLSSRQLKPHLMTIEKDNWHMRANVLYVQKKLLVKDFSTKHAKVQHMRRIMKTMIENGRAFVDLIYLPSHTPQPPSKFRS